MREDIWIKTFISALPFKEDQITNYFNYEPRFNGVSSSNKLPKVKDGACL